MKLKTLTLALLFTLLLAARASAQGFDYDAYEPRTLADVIAKYDGKELPDPKMKDGSKTFGASFPSRVKVTYAGESRKLSAERKEFLAAWVKTHALDEMYLTLFEDDWKFSEGGVDYWLPVQKQVASYFEKELKKGDALNIYTVIAGGRKTAGKWDWIILVNEFEKLPGDTARHGKGSAGL